MKIEGLENEGREIGTVKATILKDGRNLVMQKETCPGLKQQIHQQGRTHNHLITNSVCHRMASCHLKSFSSIRINPTENDEKADRSGIMI